MTTDCLRGECGLCIAPVLAVDGTLDHRDVFLSLEQKSLDTEMGRWDSRISGEPSLPSPAERRRGRSASARRA